MTEEYFEYNFPDEDELDNIFECDSIDAYEGENESDY